MKLQTTNINKLDLSVVSMLRSYNSELPASDRTKVIYLDVGRRYNEYLVQNNQPLSAESIKLFLDSLDLKPSTMNTYLSALIKLVSEQAHFSGAHRLQIAAIKEDINQHTNRVKLTKSVKKDAYFTAAEIDEIISKADEKTGLIIEFLFHSGCRISEALGVKRSDIVVVKNAAKIKVLGKGNKERYVYVDKLLIAYIDDEFEGCTHLFETTKRSPYNRSNVWRMVTKAGRLAGFSVTNHCFRHSCAMHLLNKEQSGDLKYVQKYLGHSSPAITAEFYDHSEPDYEVVDYFK